MAKFELKRISNEGSVNLYYKLIRDGECLYDIFRDEIIKGGNLVSDLDRLIRFIKWDEQGKELPKGSISTLKGREKSDHVPDYEFRTEKLRLYFFRDESIGKIIVLGGLNDKKKQSDKHIATLRRIKKEYFLWRKMVK